MASLALQPRAASAASARELDPRAALPYARHVTDQIVGLDTQALMLTFQLDGASFETADVRDLNDWHAKLNGAWRNLADDRLAIWHHLVRREHSGYPEGQFRSAFAADLDARYRDRLGATRMFVNELYVTLVLHPGRDPANRAGAWLSSESDEIEAIKRLEDAGRDLAQPPLYAARWRRGGLRSGSGGPTGSPRSGARRSGLHRRGRSTGRLEDPPSRHRHSADRARRPRPPGACGH